jgi:RNA polymerase sigma-70 factor, ECF subfamily
MTLDAAVAEHRGWLLGMAYRMLGSAAEAEDAVQEAFARLSVADGVDDPAAWLRTVTTRICLDVLRSARVRRETYVGPWLPEPLLVDDADPATAVADAESLSLAFLVVLESLSPEERIAFLLHDVFGTPFDEVARSLGRTPAAARQLASRGRRRLREHRPRFEADARRRQAVAAAFLDACEGGDVDALLALLADDVVLVSDGGGVVSAARKPVVGAEAVLRMLTGLARKAGPSAAFQRLPLNATPGALVSVAGEADTAMVLEVSGGQVVRINMVRNPEKLAGLYGGRDARG